MVDENFPYFIRQLGRGKKGRKDLSFEEAETAMGMILDGYVSDLQLGAFLMLLRVKEETAEEMSGFVTAVRKRIPLFNLKTPVDLDIASYAGKRKQNAWFILALLAVADAGFRLVVHGSSCHTRDRLFTEKLFRDLELPVIDSPNALDAALESKGLAYIPLALLHPTLETLINLKPELGLRSPVNTLVRLINPVNASNSITSIFHPAYGPIHQQTALKMGFNLLTFKGEGGEPEIRPDANTKLLLSRNGIEQEHTIPRRLELKAEPQERLAITELRQAWKGLAMSDYAFNATIGTIESILLVLTPEEASREKAEILWHNRNTARLK